MSKIIYHWKIWKIYFLAVHILKYNNINNIDRLSAFLIWYIYVSTVIFSSSWRGLFIWCNGRNGILVIISYFKLTIQILRQSFLIGEKCQWCDRQENVYYDLGAVPICRFTICRLPNIYCKSCKIISNITNDIFQLTNHGSWWI